MATVGKLLWTFSAGRIPFRSHGKEPELGSHDKIAVLNASDDDASLHLTIFYEEESPVGTYKFEVKANRLRKVRFNDLIDPLVVELEKNYSCMIRSNVPVVVQFSRMNTGSAFVAETSSMAFPVPDKDDKE